MRRLACQQWSLSPPSDPCEFARLTSGMTNLPKHFNHSTPTQSQVSLSHRPRPRSEECRHSSREGTPTGWASLREILFALGPLGPEVGMGADGSPLERRVSDKAACERLLPAWQVSVQSGSSLKAPLLFYSPASGRRRDAKGYSTLPQQALHELLQGRMNACAVGVARLARYACRGWSGDAPGVCPVV